jgi:hypothetical protein
VSTGRGMRLAPPTLRIAGVPPLGVLVEDPAFEGLVGRSSIRIMSDSIKKFEARFNAMLAICVKLKQDLALGSEQAKEDERVAETLLFAVVKGHPKPATQPSASK